MALKYLLRSAKYSLGLACSHDLQLRSCIHHHRNITFRWLRCASIHQSGSNTGPTFVFIFLHAMKQCHQGHHHGPKVSVSAFHHLRRASVSSSSSPIIRQSLARSAFSAGRSFLGLVPGLYSCLMASGSAVSLSMWITSVPIPLRQARKTIYRGSRQSKK